MEFHSKIIKKMTSRAGAHRKPKQKIEIDAKHKVVNRMEKRYHSTSKMIANEMKEFNEFELLFCSVDGFNLQFVALVHNIR